MSQGQVSIKRFIKEWKKNMDNLLRIFIQNGWCPLSSEESRSSKRKQHVLGIKWAHYYIEEYKLPGCKQIVCSHCVASTERAKRGENQINPQPIQLHHNSRIPSNGILTYLEWDLMEVKSGRLAIQKRLFTCQNHIFAIRYYNVVQKYSRLMLIDITCCKTVMAQNSPLFKIVK